MEFCLLRIQQQRARKSNSHYLIGLDVFSSDGRVFEFEYTGIAQWV